MANFNTDADPAVLTNWFQLNHYRDLWRDSPEARPTSSYNAA
jgi:hypothetical protein